MSHPTQAAVKAANALLAKYPDDQLAKVLKTLAIHYLNKKQEAQEVGVGGLPYKHIHIHIIHIHTLLLTHHPPPPQTPQLLDEVLQQHPTDIQVLQTLVTVCKVMGKTTALPALYEAAVVANPGDIDLLRGLFAVYVRYVGGGGRLVWLGQ